MASRWWDGDRKPQNPTNPLLRGLSERRGGRIRRHCCEDPTAQLPLPKVLSLLIVSDDCAQALNMADANAPGPHAHNLRSC